jgi:ABC-type lipoprotein release transport system permease subunit
MDSFEWTVVRRYLRSRGKSYVALVSSISMWGLAVGLASLVVIFSITSGFEDVFRDRILGLYPHLVIIGRGGDLARWPELQGQLSSDPALVSVSPATYDEMMISFRGRRGEAIVKGVDIRRESVVRSLSSFVDTGALERLGQAPTISDTDMGLEISGLIGGSTGVLVVREEGPPQYIPVYLESSLGEGVEVISALTLPVSLLVEGPFFEAGTRRLAPWTSSGFLSFQRGTTMLSVQERELHWESAVPRVALVLVPGTKDPHAVLVCPLPSPGPTTGPAHLCVVNQRARAIQVSGRDGMLAVAAGEARVFEGHDTVLPRVLLGKYLAQRLDADLGDSIRLVSPFYSFGSSTGAAKRSQSIADTFEVAGMVDLGFYEYDSKLALLDFDSARQFLHQGSAARWLEIRVADLFRSEESRRSILRSLSGLTAMNLARYLPVHEGRYEVIASEVSQAASPLGALDGVLRFVEETRYANPLGELSWGASENYRVIGWEEMNRPLFSSMKTQKLVLSLFFLIIIVVAAFNVVSSQVMIVREKQGDIAILKAMGASNRQISSVFLSQGMILGGLGILAGLVLSAIVLVVLAHAGFPLDPEVYFVSAVPVKVNLWDIAVACILSAVAIYLSVAVAARRAAARSPVAGLRELE